MIQHYRPYSYTAATGLRSRMHDDFDAGWRVESVGLDTQPPKLKSNPKPFPTPDAFYPPQNPPSSTPSQPIENKLL